jgi:hypothetical protein
MGSLGQDLDQRVPLYAGFAMIKIAMTYLIKIGQNCN